MGLSTAETRRVIEAFRSGLPPDGYMREFTVGRSSQIDELLGRLKDGIDGPLLVEAEAGFGKSHLLRLVREQAHEGGYATSWVELDSLSGVGFDRMDQVVGAVWRGFQIPKTPGRQGVCPCLDFFCNAIEQCRTSSNDANFWCMLTNNWQWDSSVTLESPALFIALRAWKFGNPQIRNLVEEWLCCPWTFNSYRRNLYEQLVASLYKYFRDPRLAPQFCAGNLFAFDVEDYAQSWAVLRDLNTLCCEAGLRGMVILFDEFEKSFTAANKSTQQFAVRNFVRMCLGKPFEGLALFAATPHSVRRFEQLLLQFGDSRYHDFAQVPRFQLSPLDRADVVDLAVKVMQAHAIAYDWNPESRLSRADLLGMAEEFVSFSSQSRTTRDNVRAVVMTLDKLLEGEA